MVGHNKSWAVFLQSAIVLGLLTPGVWYVGCAYALVTQAYVLACVLLGFDGSIRTAARVNTAAAISNALLSVIIWKSIDNVLDAVMAGIRAAGVCAISVTMVVSSENLHYVQGKIDMEVSDSDDEKEEGEPDSGDETTDESSKGVGGVEEAVQGITYAPPAAAAAAALIGTTGTRRRGPRR